MFLFKFRSLGKLSSINLLFHLISFSFSVVLVKFFGSSLVRMQLHVIAPFLRGGALKSLKRYTTREGTEATWNDFRDQLIKEHEPHDIQNRLKVQLMRLKQDKSCLSRRVEINFANFKKKL